MKETELKPIDILANDINQHCPDLTDNYCGDTHCVACLANALYNAGYRKQEQGVWIFEYEFYGKMICSNCKEEALVNECNEYVDSDFCPNCGAKMKGGAE